MTDETISFSRSRVESVLACLECLAGGDVRIQAPLSAAQDELDAISHGINVMAGELHFRVQELQRAQSELVQSGKLAALGEVSSGLAHELNNPLTIIRGYSEMALDVLGQDASQPVDRARLEQCLRRIDTNIDRMESIIRHIMEFSRQTRQKRGTVRIDEVIQKSFILLNEQLRLKNILVEKFVADEELFALGDELRLEQVLINLLTNARDAIFEAHGEAGGRIRVRLVATSSAELMISIEDNGIGMDEEVMSKAFNPFFTTKGVGKGTGLGLSISLGIMGEHSGRISCRSQPGQGSEFTLTLPRWVPDPKRTPQ